MASAARKPPSPITADAEDRDRLKKIIRERSFREGQLFRLASGVESNIYFNMKPTMLSGEGSCLLAKLVLRRLASENVAFVGGLEMGAVPIVSAAITASFETGAPLNGFWVRKRPKDHGAKLLIEGPSADELRGRRVAILEDVCTTGASAMIAVDEVQRVGGEVVLVLAVVDRQEGAARAMAARGLRFDALFRADEFISAGFERLPPVFR